MSISEDLLWLITFVFFPQHLLSKQVKDCESRSDCIATISNLRILAAKNGGMPILNQAGLHLE